MTRKRFIKKLRSWRFTEKEIADTVKAVVEHPVGISYDKAMEIVIKQRWKDLVDSFMKKPVIDYIDYTWVPMEYVDTAEFAYSDFKLMGLDLALKTDNMYVIKTSDLS